MNRFKHFLPATVVLLLGLMASCEQPLRLKPVRMELFKLYDNVSATNTSGRFKRIYFDPYMLAVSETNRFSFGDKDIRDIVVSTNRGTLFVSFYLKRNRRADFERFTTVNSNAYIAVMVNGDMQNIARLKEPVSNGRLQFSCGLSQIKEISRFINLFVL